MSHRRTPAALATLALLCASMTGMPAALAQTADVSPPGANDWSCKPSTAHPYPVILVPGTFANMATRWATLSPALKSQGYCVFALNYGATNGVYATGPVADSARQLASFVDTVLASTGARKVDLVGHSQGGMMPRYYLGFLGGANKVNHLVGIAPSNHGTRGLITPSLDSIQRATSVGGSICQACVDQQAGSPFLTELNSIGDTVPGPAYTVISTTHDAVVTPYPSQFLAGPRRQVTNITIQDKCPTDVSDHGQAPNDPVTQRLVSDALGQPAGRPGNPKYQPSCA
ncbi:esterase/lipase family protein [Arthrobacter sp. NPDC058130]|uniref:esterase/lipase family protein n=1 Tax=Arthrobacter sp. NPDC058130 TaxID=3346353 RepID=UPI0036EBB07B